MLSTERGPLVKHLALLGLNIPRQARRLQRRSWLLHLEHLARRRANPGHRRPGPHRRIRLLLRLRSTLPHEVVEALQKLDLVLKPLRVLLHQGLRFHIRMDELLVTNR